MMRDRQNSWLDRQRRPMHRSQLQMLLLACHKEPNRRNSVSSTRHRQNMDIHSYHSWAWQTLTMLMRQRRADCTLSRCRTCHQDRTLSRNRMALNRRRTRRMVHRNHNYTSDSTANSRSPRCRWFDGAHDAVEDVSERSTDSADSTMNGLAFVWNRHSSSHQFWACSTLSR